MSSLLRYDTPSWLLAFTTGRGCGVEAFGLREEELALPRQTHSDHVCWMEAPGRPDDTDAVITDRPGLCCCVKTADCIPILLYDVRRRIVAAVHSGWRGTVARIANKTIREMGSCVADLCAIIGPGISQQAFEVGDEVYDRFAAEGFPMQHIARRFPVRPSLSEAQASLPVEERWHIDLWDANRWLLEQAGVPSIHVEQICTMATERFYSARRETIHTGRNMNGIMIKP